jgi:hypothetical protein
MPGRRARCRYRRGAAGGSQHHRRHAGRVPEPREAARRADGDHRGPEAGPDVVKDDLQGRVVASGQPEHPLGLQEWTIPPFSAKQRQARLIVEAVAPRPCATSLSAPCRYGNRSPAISPNAYAVIRVPTDPRRPGAGQWLTWRLWERSAPRAASIVADGARAGRGAGVAYWTASRTSDRRPVRGCAT